MMDAAEEAALLQPPYWDAEVVDVQQRTFDIAVLQVRTETPLPYLAGQSVAVQALDRRPREWRYYTPASAPGEREFEFHVRLIPGGPVSTALAQGTFSGDRLRLGAPVGRMTLDTESDLPVLLVAGSTGLAPMKAIVEQLAQTGERRTHLFFGARTIREMYDQAALDALDAQYPWLSVVTAASDDTRWTGPQGMIDDVVIASGEWGGHDAYVCGPPLMVESTMKKLMAQGLPERRIRFDDFGES
jgi:NAD(P)H-flavin reductase